MLLSTKKTFQFRIYKNVSPAMKKAKSYRNFCFSILDAMIIRISNISLVHMMNVVDNVLTGEEGVAGELCSGGN